MKRLAIFLSTFITLHCANADLLTDCMTKISNDQDFQNRMTSEIITDDSLLTQEGAIQKKSQILNLIAKKTLELCQQDLSTIAKRANGKVWHPRNGKTYAYQFKMTDMFQNTNLKTAIFVYNKSTLGPGDTVKLSDIQKLYWSDKCSDHRIWDNLSDKAAVNIAGQRVFSQYGGSDNEFFLDFEEGNNRRAFPGIILAEITNQGHNQSEAIVMFNNLITADQAASQFASALNGTACSNDSLSVYVVQFNADTNFENETKKTWWNDYGVALFGLGGYINNITPRTIYDIQEVKILSGPHQIQ